MEIRTATPDDAGAIQAIYAPIVRETHISFELEPPTVEEMRSRIANTLKTFPWLVALHECQSARINSHNLKDASERLSLTLPLLEP